jgi:lipase chaperone LimK
LKLRALAAVALCGAALLWAALLWRGAAESDPTLQAQAASQVAALAPAVPRADPAAAAAASAARTPEAFEQWMTRHSSLRGVSLDGAWDVDVQGRLRPTLALRRRFDQLLSLVGETGVDEIGAFVAHDVRETFGADAAARMLALWQSYVALQQHAWRQRVDMRERSNWGPALAERQQVRRQLLGDDVARAFFGDDDAQLIALLNTPPLATPVARTSIVESTKLEPAAAERLRLEEAAWADWERRLADARRELAALQARAELSSLQREQAMTRYVEQHFDVSERVRVRALLQFDSRG